MSNEAHPLKHRGLNMAHLNTNMARYSCSMLVLQGWRDSKVGLVAAQNHCSLSPRTQGWDTWSHDALGLHNAQYFSSLYFQVCSINTYISQTRCLQFLPVFLPTRGVALHLSAFTRFLLIPLSTPYITHTSFNYTYHTSQTPFLRITSPVS